MSKPRNATAGIRRFALYASSQGNYFFQEIRDLIGGGLKALGHTVEFRDERQGYSQRADWHVVVAPHEFFELGASESLAAKPSPPNLILFNTEQPSTYWLKLSAKYFPRAAAIWDINFESSLHITRRGYACDYLPLGRIAGSPMFRDVSRLPVHEETRRLPPAVRDRSGLGEPFAARPIDLLFLGHASARRERFFACYGDRLNRYNCFVHKPDATRPMIPGRTTQMNTLTSVGLAQRSKILLNLHHGVDKYFEWHRIVLLGIAQRALVISEPCTLAPPFGAGVDFVETAADDLPDRIEYYLGSEAGRREAQEIIDHASARFATRCRLSEMLRPLVEQLDAPARTRLSSAERFFPVAVTPKSSSSLEICVVTPEVDGEGPNADCGSAQVALAEALAADGHTVVLLHTEGRPAEGHSLSHSRKRFAERGIDYVPLPADIDAPVEGAPACCRSYEAYLWLRRRLFQVVHFPIAQGIGFYSLLARHQGLEFERTRFCLNVHAPRAWQRLAGQELVTSARELELDFMERECARLADAVTTSTAFMLEWLEDQDWALPEQRRVRPDPIPAGAAPAPSSPQPIDELVYCGPLQPGPGLALFCDALDRLNAVGPPEFKVTFAGNTSGMGQRTAHYLQQRSRQWSFTWEATYVCSGPLSSAIRKVGQLAVLPSVLDDSPLVIRQLLEGQRPFLAVHNGGIPELIDPADHSGCLCAGTAATMATALQAILEEGIRIPRPAPGSAAQIRDWLQWHQSWTANGLESGAGRNPDGPDTSPLVSVCLVHFNRPDFLAQSLDSLRAQDYSNFEVILVDDGSTQPEALALLDRLETEFRQRNWRIIRQENRYLGAARNTAARAARGEFLLFMDDDNFAKPNEISRFVRVALKTGAEILTCAMDLFAGAEPPGPVLKPKARWVFLGPAAATGAIRNCFGDANGLLRRDTFWRVGGFTEDYGITHEDWEFYARAVLEGCRMETLPEALFWYRVADGSMIRNTPQFANLQRSLRPYLGAVPAPLHGLLHFLQGSTCSPREEPVPVATQQSLVRLHQSSVAAASEMLRAGLTRAAETLFMEVLQSAECSGHPSIVLRASLDVGRALCQSERSRIAIKVLERAMTVARAASDHTALREAEALLAAAKRRCIPVRGTAPRQTPQAIPVSGHPEAPAGAALARTPPTEPATLVSPSVSIIIPVSNNLALTRSCLESIAATSGNGRQEIILVDNASTDGTEGFLREEEEAGRIRVITNAANEGFARACNQGAAAARGPLLLFLNNDTQVTDGWLEALSAAAARPQVGIVGAKLLYADNRIQHAGIGFINDIPDHPHRYARADAPEVNQFRELDMVTGACLLIHRDLFMQLGGFDEVYRNGVEDADLCLRVRDAGHKVVYEPKAVVYHAEGQSAGRFNHVTDNLKIFFQRWSKFFNADKCFLVSNPPKVVRASRSALFPPATVESADPVRVAWEGTFLDYGSLSHVNRELCRQLGSRPEIRLTLVGRSGGAPVPAPLQALSLADQVPEDVRIVVRHSWPPDWQPPARGAFVVIQPWEFGTLPEQWVREAERVTEFWVPSNYVRQCYLDSGVPEAKVRVVPNGIDPERFHPGVAPMKLATEKSFKFLFVGGTIGRKGADILLKTYLETFTAQDDVCLVFKDFGGQSVYTGQTLEAQIRTVMALPDSPEILYLNEELAPEELPGLYTACDCLVHPYRGEGFGLPVLEAMACGLPTIITGGGAADDFADEELAYRLPARRLAIGSSVSGMRLAGTGWLLEPDSAALAARMKWMPGHREEARAKGRAAAKYVRRDWTWDRAAQKAAERLQALKTRTESAKPAAVQTGPRPSAPLELPLCAAIGRLDEARAFLGRKCYRQAWEMALDAVIERPFHPEGCLLLAEIAARAGDVATGRQCAQYARALAPGWQAPRQFLQKPLKSGARPTWLALPDWISNRKSQISSRLTVCVIARNEERFLPQCLASVRPVATQIVVVDTGSTDRTVEIAQSFGAEVRHFDWCDDFSAARNAALELARGDWILMLDADEELPADQHPNLQSDVSRAGVIAYRLPLLNQGEESQGHNYVPRLFRNAPGAFYQGRIHEQVFASLLSHCKSWGLETGLGTTRLLHHGYTEELVRDRNKVERNLRLLQRAIVERPGDPNLLMNLGLELIRADNLSAGLEKYREAFRLMSAQPPAEVVPELREVLLTQLTSHLYKVRAHGEVVSVLTSPLAQQCELTASLHYALGLSCFELQQYPEAAQHLRQCLDKRGQPALSPINTDILTAAPCHCLALCLARSGDPSGAEMAFQTALNEPGGNEHLKPDYARFLSEQGRPVDALHRLHEVISQDPTLAEAWQLGGEIALSQPGFLAFARDWTGEALRFLPEDPVIVAQRAEALLMRQEIANARPLWEQASNGARPPRALAALILCAAVDESAEVPATSEAEEAAASQAFLEWYQRLLSAGARDTILRLNSRVDAFRNSLPTAARLLDAAMAEAAAHAA